MEENPIIFTTKNVKLVMTELKTETRRPVTPQWSSNVVPKEHSQVPGYWIPYEPVPGGRLCNGENGSRKDDCGIYCPYGTKGGKLWVRETWCKTDWGIEYKTCMENSNDDAAMKDYGYTWKPSIHMPKTMSRTSLNVLEIKMERLQSITNKSIKAEGVKLPPDELFPTINYEDKIRIQFERLWDSIYAKPKPRYHKVNGIKTVSYYESYPWKDLSELSTHNGKVHFVRGNPWVWAITFEKIDGEQHV